MNLRPLLRLALAALLLLPAAPGWARTADGLQKLVLVAGKRSHGPREHEFNAGVQLLAKCLSGVPGLKVEFVLNGWPAEETVFADADAVVFYMDGGAGHEVAKEDGARLAKIDAWAARGVGIGCIHYGVEVLRDHGGQEFKRWIGGYYENLFSCNPMWEPNFTQFPKHPIANGVKPFQIRDEWYINMRFADGFDTDAPQEKNGTKFAPILIAPPSDAVRAGPYVAPKGPYPHIQAASGRNEVMLWVVERPDGGRGLGFTGGHYHNNWGNDDYRKTVLNALVWLAKVEVPADGVASSVTPADLDANLDPKGQKK